MRLALGLLLMVLALVGGYFVLIGKFPPTTANSGGSPSGAAPPPEPLGQALQTGSGGGSVVGRLTHLGVPAFIQSNDMQASRGGYR